MTRPIDTIIVGAQKAGTTSLLRHMAEHKRIKTHLQNEFAFFIRDEEYRQGYGKIFPMYFNALAIQAEDTLLAKNVDILYSPSAIARLKQHNPASKLIVMIRNPIDRAYSAYWFNRRRGIETRKTFEAAIECEIFNTPSDHKPLMYLSKGRYHEHLQQIFEQFPTDQVDIYLFETFTADPLQVCRSIVERLHLDSVNYYPQTSTVYNQASLARNEAVAKLVTTDNLIKRFFRGFVNKRIAHYIRQTIRGVIDDETTKPPEIAPQTRNLLQEYYRDYNRDLSTMLNWDLSCWD